MKVRIRYQNSKPKIVDARFVIHK